MCPHRSATLFALNPYHWMATKFVRYMHLIFVAPLQNQQKPVTQPQLCISASGKHTERLHGSSEPIAAWQPNHEGPVPTSKLHEACTVFLHSRKSCFDHSSFYVLIPCRWKDSTSLRHAEGRNSISRLILVSCWAPRPWMKGLISTDFRALVASILSNWPVPIVDLYIAASGSLKKNSKRT